MEFSEQVLILQTGKFRESDLWLRLLSPSRGIFTAFAFGGSRSRRRFIGCLDVFNQVHFRIKKSRSSEYLSLEEGVLIRGVDKLRNDWSRLGLANNCANFIQAFGINSDGAREAYLLFNDLLRHLDSDAEICGLLPLFFRMRLAFDQGYSISLSACNKCSRSLIPTGAFLDIENGNILCPECSQKVLGATVFLSTESLMSLKTVKYNKPDLWGYLAIQKQNKKMSAQALRESGRAIDEFIQYHVGLRLRGAYFCRI